MRPRDVQGFTLLELLVAVTITLVLAGIMLSVTGSTLGVWKRTQDTFSGNAQAKLALDMIERDLQSACHFRDGIGNIWLAADVITSATGLNGHGWLTTSLMKPATSVGQVLIPSSPSFPRISDARFGLSGTWLRFFAATSESSTQLAIPRAISYQLVRRPVSGAVVVTNPAEIRYTLYRSVANNNETLATGYNLTTYGAVLTNPSSSADALASNVVDFGVWLYARNADGSLRRIFPASNADLEHRANDAIAPGDGNRMPDVIEVMVRLLSDEGARLIAAVESGLTPRPPAFSSDDVWWWSVVEANSRVFVRRVELKGVAP